MTRLGMPSSQKHIDSRIFGKALAVMGAAKLEGIVPRDVIANDLAGDDAYEVAAALDATTKAAIGGVEYGASSGTPAWSAIAQGTFDETVIGQIPGTRRLPFVHKVAAGIIIGSGASWRAEGKAIRVAPVSFSGVALARDSVGGIAVVSREFVDLALRDNSSAETLSRLVRDAIRRAVDSAFCGSDAAGSGQPAGVANSAQSVSSTGTTVAQVAADVRSMVHTMVDGGVSLRSGVWILSAEAFSFLSTIKALDQNGTTLAGRPIVTDAPPGTFMLLATDFLSYAVGDSVSIAVSTAALIEMDSSGTGDTLTPAAATSHFVSLFQSDAVGVKGLLDVSWSLDGPSDSNGRFAAVVLSGSSYA